MATLCVVSRGAVAGQCRPRRRSVPGSLDGDGHEPNPAGRDGPAEPARGRYPRQCRTHHRGGDQRPRPASGGRHPVSRAGPVRLSAGGSAAALEHAAAHRGGPAPPARRGARHLPGGRLSLAGRRQALQRGGGDRRRRAAGHLLQAAVAQLPGVRREALFRAGPRGLRGGHQGRAGGHQHLRGHLVPRADGPGARGGRAAHAQPECLAVPPRQAARARGNPCPACPRRRHAGGLREPGGRPGRAGVRRRQLRGGCRWARLPARTDVRGVPVPGGPALRRSRRGGAAQPSRAATGAGGQRLSGAGGRGARLRGEERFQGCGAGAVRRHRLRADPGGGGGCAGRRTGRGGDDALSLHRTDEPGGRRAAGAYPGGRLPGAADRRDGRGLHGRPGAGVRGAGSRHHRGEPAGALPRHAADGDLQQEGQPGADHRQQERSRGRLLHAVWRHGRRVRCAQGCAQDPGVPPVRVPQRAGTGRDHSAAGHRPAAVSRAGARAEG